MVYFLTKNAEFVIILEGLGMANFGVLHGHFVCFGLFWYIFMSVWYICGRFGTFSAILIFCAKKNLANLARLIAVTAWPRERQRLLQNSARSLVHRMVETKASSEIDFTGYPNHDDDAGVTRSSRPTRYNGGVSPDKMPP
jgi:hypothetical protein